MNQINKDEMFGNLQKFLKSKGIALQEGSYTQRLRKGCGLLTDSINVSQQAFTRAKDAVDRKLSRLKEAIHKQTAPKSAPAQAKASNKGSGARAAGKASKVKAKAAASKRRPKKK